MILGWGGYRHDPGEVVLSIEQTPITNAAGVREKTKHRWTINGVKHAETIAEMTGKIYSLEKAYAANGKNLILYAADGSTATAHKLLSASSATGTRVVSGPAYPQSEVYALQRSYQIVVECETNVIPGIASQGAPVPLQFTETVQQYGGGPLVSHVTLLDDKPHRQITAKHTPFVLVQSGQATAEGQYPTASPPLFPSDLREDPRFTFTETPTNEGSQGRVKIMRTVSWSYVFESANPLRRQPQRRRR